MSFQPVVPLSGYVGWTFLSRTLESQTEAFNQSPSIQRDADYFREAIGQVQTAEQLVADRRLLGVALTAFGLQDDINSKAFVQQILEEGTIEPSALANKLSDKRYLAFAKSFGFGDFATPRTELSYFPDEIIETYEARSFEAAVGAQNEALRLSLNLERELDTLATNSESDTARWFSMMGQPPMRRVFEGALALPTSFSRIDIDQQLEVFKERSEQIFGTQEIADFADPDLRERLIQRFLLMDQLQSGQSMNRSQIALSLLS